MLQKLVKRSKTFDEMKKDYGPEPVVRHSIDPETGHLIVPSGMFGEGVSYPPMPFTEHAFNQLTDRLGTTCWPGRHRSLPRDFLLRCEPDVRANVLNHWIERTDADKQWRVRTFGERVRAVVTDQYAPIWNTWVLEMAQKAVTEKANGWCEILQAHVGPDIVRLKLLFNYVDPGDGNGDYGLGAYCENSEIGTHKLRVWPLVKKTSCNNSIYGVHEGRWECFHRGSYELLEHDFIMHMGRAFDVADRTLLALLKAHATPMPDFEEQVERMCEEHGWNDTTKNHIYQGAGTDNTYGSMVDGMTFAAQDFEDIQRQIDMELIASQFLAAMVKEKELVQ